MASQIVEGTAPKGMSLHDGLLYWGCQIMVAPSSAFKHAILYKHHSTVAAGHPGVDRTLCRIASCFYWHGLRKDVKDFVMSCLEC